MFLPKGIEFRFPIQTLNSYFIELASHMDSPIFLKHMPLLEKRLLVV